jgi:starch-binding outer membrane protein, SusD/RagB family
MKSRIIKKIIPFAAAIIFFSSCNKVLDRQPELYVDESQSIVDKKSADAALTGAYNSLSQNSNQGVTFRYAVNLASDNLKWVGNTPTNREFDVYGIFATNTRVAELWAAIYKTINIANNIIAIVPTINDVTFNQADRNNSRGEAFFLRAYSYFDLVRLWGNVPIQTNPTKTTADANGIGNSTPVEVYKRVEQDLDSAELLLSSTLNRNRANKFTAKALKARLYLYLKDWEKAESYSTELINSNTNFKLVKPYNLFYASKNTAESIFEIDYTVNNKNSWATNWFASNITGGKKELLPTDEFIALAKDPNIGGDRSALLLTISGVIYGNMNFKIATGDDQVYAIRLAEMYLIRAEARAENATPDIAGALQDLNAVRVRSNVPALASVTNTNELLDKILLERRIEFAYESQRWFDLIRRGKAQSVLGIADANKLLFPIPKQQILVNPALIQNPGYN